MGAIGPIAIAPAYARETGTAGRSRRSGRSSRGPILKEPGPAASFGRESTTPPGRGGSTRRWVYENLREWFEAVDHGRLSFRDLAERLGREF